LLFRDPIVQLNPEALTFFVESGKNL